MERQQETPKPDANHGPLQPDPRSLALGKRLVLRRFCEHLLRIQQMAPQLGFAGGHPVARQLRRAGVERGYHLHRRWDRLCHEHVAPRVSVAASLATPVVRHAKVVVVPVCNLHRVDNVLGKQDGSAAAHGLMQLQVDDGYPEPGRYLVLRGRRRRRRARVDAQRRRSSQRQICQRAGRVDGHARVDAQLPRQDGQAQRPHNRQAGSQEHLAAMQHLVCQRRDGGLEEALVVLGRDDGAPCRGRKHVVADVDDQQHLREPLIAYLHRRRPERVQLAAEGWDVQQPVRALDRVEILLNHAVARVAAWEGAYHLPLGPALHVPVAAVGECQARRRRLAVAVAAFCPVSAMFLEELGGCRLVWKDRLEL